MWKHCCAFVCALLALLSNTSVNVRTVSDPSTLPRLEFTDLKYTGAFRLPAGMTNGDSFSIGGHPVTYNPARNSLFIGSLGGNVAEVSIPAPVNSANVDALPFASYLQGFYEPTEGHLGTIDSHDASVDGILVYGNRLYGTGSIFYDANNVQRVSHFSRSLTLSQTSFNGWSSVWQSDHSGFVSGYMALVPSEWQAKLGGPAITGQCCIPIVWRTSWGPSAFAFNPTHIGQSLVSATPLLYYDNDHQTLGQWSGSNPTYGATTQVKGAVIVSGTRTILFFGRNGLGPYCYGNGTNNQSLHGSMADNGAPWCYDPTSTDKGQHAYPYRYQIWAYDLNEFAKVKAGTKKPWEVVPYAVWPFELPTPEPSIKIGGVGYDSATQTIYLSQMRANKDGYSNRPIIHVLKVGGVAGSPLPVPTENDAPPPDNTEPPPPTSSGKLTAVAIAASKSAPQAPGTTINLTATPTGGQAPHQYKWQLHDGAKWSAISAWSTSSSYPWTPSKANTAYRLSVWVRSAGKTADAPEVTANLNFPISGTASPGTPTAPQVSSVGIAASRVAPQPPSTSITFTAMPTGGGSPLQYKWSVSNGSSWSTAMNWNTSSTFTWTPTSANAGYEVRVWVRSSGNSGDAAEAQVAMDFPIVASSSTPPPTTPPPTTPPPSQTEKVTSVGITASKASPQQPGTTIAMTATPLGGVAPHQYKWLLHDGKRWNTVSGWTSSGTYNWTPSTANGGYKLSVWVRSAGATKDVAEASTNLSYPISATAPPSTAPPPTSQPLVSSVTLTSNKATPQNRGTSITWTAAPTGGVGPHEYKFYVWDSAAWVVTRGWSASNTFTWTPNLANPYYKVKVWVRSAGNHSDNYEAETTSAVYQIK